jgi:hypothetical protein
MLMIVVSDIMGIPGPVFIVMQVGPGFIQHHFVSPVQIIVPASSGKGRSENPMACI